MSKSSARDNDRDETVRSEIYCGGYVTTVDEVELTNYLVHLPSHNDFIMNINVQEELNDRGNFGHSGDDGDDARDFNNTMREL